MKRPLRRCIACILTLGLLGACTDSSQTGSGTAPLDKVIVAAPPPAPIPQPTQSAPVDANPGNTLEPTKELITTWWKSHAREDMTIEGEPIAVFLISKEKAYVVPVGFYGRGRNDIAHTVMVRPSMKEVRELTEVGNQDIKVLDLDRDGVSEVAATSVGSGQGTEVRVRSIVQFDGWNPVTLREARSSEGCGFVDDKMSCSSETVTWKFSDLDGDGVVDLVEEVVTEESEGNDPKKTSKSTSRFLFKNRQFVSQPG